MSGATKFVFFCSLNSFYWPNHVSLLSCCFQRPRFTFESLRININYTKQRGMSARKVFTSWWRPKVPFFYDSGILRNPSPGSLRKRFTSGFMFTRPRMMHTSTKRPTPFKGSSSKDKWGVMDDIKLLSFGSHLIFLLMLPTMAKHFSTKVNVIRDNSLSATEFDSSSKFPSYIAHTARDRSLLNHHTDIGNIKKFLITGKQHNQHELQEALKLKEDEEINSRCIKIAIPTRKRKTNKINKKQDGISIDGNKNTNITNSLAFDSTLPMTPDQLTAALGGIISYPSTVEKSINLSENIQLLPQNLMKGSVADKIRLYGDHEHVSLNQQHKNSVYKAMVELTNKTCPKSVSIPYGSSYTIKHSILPADILERMDANYRSFQQDSSNPEQFDHFVQNLCDITEQSFTINMDHDKLFLKMFSQLHSLRLHNLVNVLVETILSTSSEIKSIDPKIKLAKLRQTIKYNHEVSKAYTGSRSKRSIKLDAVAQQERESKYTLSSLKNSSWVRRMISDFKSFESLISFALTADIPVRFIESLIALKYMDMPADGQHRQQLRELTKIKKLLVDGGYEGSSYFKAVISRVEDLMTKV
ncbi:hypothetical protein CANARDRAFT_53017 [[Candida] arabinofermentans NRRL YB-2248]|uniref:Uncharacterized protein n=1 Tax=[Candida] arabinofermentans NRRL YB-2248 TaxID=983967 RepID=A0A1E4T7V6_9ASCO|nr:hypothetical protein CANARDRAFT_53017 [[Candida] arabinofermentans NRRL YB-2248]